MYEYDDKHAFAMCCLLLALLLGGFVWFSGPAHSQEAPSGPPCGVGTDMLKKLQAEYGETVTAGGIVGQEVLEITTNKRTGTFTILTRRMDGTACLIAGGKGWALADAARMKGPGL